MSKKSKTDQSSTSNDQLVTASYNAGKANGRVEAIEESMEAVAALIIKAEALHATLDENANPVLRENARHTLQALYLAFAAVSGAVNGSAAFNDLLLQSKQRLSTDIATRH